MRHRIATVLRLQTGLMRQARHRKSSDFAITPSNLNHCEYFVRFTCTEEPGYLYTQAALKAAEPSLMIESGKWCQVMNNMTRYLRKTTYLITLICVLPALPACQHINVKQVAYEVLRQEDCLRNELEDFCTRTFASEYHQYERMRQEYIRSETQTQWRVNQTELSTDQSKEIL